MKRSGSKIYDVATERSGSKIRDKVWCHGRCDEAAATQEISAELAAFIAWLEQRRFNAFARTIREAAFKNGVRETRAALQSALDVMRSRFT